MNLGLGLLKQEVATRPVFMMNLSVAAASAGHVNSENVDFGAIV